MLSVGPANQDHWELTLANLGDGLLAYDFNVISKTTGGQPQALNVRHTQTPSYYHFKEDNETQVSK